MAELHIAGEIFPDDIGLDCFEDGVGYALHGQCRVVVERQLRVSGFSVEQNPYIVAIEVGRDAELRRVRAPS